MCEMGKYFMSECDDVDNVEGKRKVIFDHTETGTPFVSITSVHRRTYISLRTSCVTYTSRPTILAGFKWLTGL